MKVLMRIAGVLVTVVVVFAAGPGTAGPAIYGGLCDASAAAPLDAGRFVVADDEHNVLRIYAAGAAGPGEPVPVFEFLGTDGDKESDLEGAAVIGDRIYWISSHSRNSDGEVKARRHRFFSTAWPAVEPIGASYADLLSDMIAAPSLAGIGLDAASNLAPEEPGGLNIEGLAATPDGDLLIGFRNPVPDGKAIVVPLTNPEAVIDGKKAEFGTPEMLDLDGRGIRSLERVGDGYLIVAGPTNDDGTFALYRWSGHGGIADAVPGIDFGDLHPEALFDLGGGGIRVLSDDGGVEIDGIECKKLPEADRSFRSIDVAIPPG